MKMDTALSKLEWLQCVVCSRWHVVAHNAINERVLSLSRQRNGKGAKRTKRLTYYARMHFILMQKWMRARGWTTKWCSAPPSLSLPPWKLRWLSCRWGNVWPFGIGCTCLYASYCMRTNIKLQQQRIGVSGVYMRTSYQWSNDITISATDTLNGWVSARSCEKMRSSDWRQLILNQTIIIIML